MNLRPRHRREVALSLAILVCVGGLSCSRVGLLSEKYTEDFYKVPRLLPEGEIPTNAAFIVYSDNQSSWRVTETFWKKSSWTNWKMLVFPFYQLYLVGNGLVGATNWLRHSPDYGGEQRRLVRDTIYAEAKRTEAAFVLNVGDMVADDGRRPAHWETFIRENKIESTLLKEVPYLPALGNHERANDPEYGFPNYTAVFDYPRFYTVELPDAAIFVLDSNLLVDQYQYIDDDRQDELFEQWFVSENEKNPSWLESRLSACDKTFRIVAMHNSPVSYGNHHDDWTDTSYGRDLIQKRQLLLGLFERHGVQIVFSGHDHLYQHSILRSADGGEIHFLIGGGGGGYLRDPADKETQVKYTKEFRQTGLEVSLENQARIYGYYLVDVTPEELVVRAMEAPSGKKRSTRLVEEIRIGAETRR